MRPTYIPDELVGAFNAIKSCFRPASPAQSSSLLTHAASSAASASFLPPCSETLPSTGQRRRHEADLDFVAHLSWFAEALCFVLPPLLTFGIPMLLGDSSQTPQAAADAVRRMFSSDGSNKPWLRWLVAVVLWLAKALISTILAIVLRFQVLERQYARLKRTPAELADEDSRFASACGLSVHYKAMLPRQEQAVPSTAVALLHGFGANTWSWADVQQRLADDCNALVTAHCMPGFGLTERSRHAGAYTLRNNGDIGRHLQARELEAGSEGAQPSRTTRVLIGHSLGCAGIATSFVEDPGDVDGIILVAPAIMANPFLRVDLKSRSVRDVQGAQCLEEQYGTRRRSEDSESEGTEARSRPFAPVWQRCLALLRPIWFAAILPALFYLVTPVIIIAARVLVRRKPFWLRGLRQAHFQPDTVTAELLYRYRLPSLVRGWEAGLLQFVKARMVRAAPERARSTAQLEKRKAAVLAEAAADSPTRRAEQGMSGADKPGDTLLLRFERAVRRRRVPVLIVHGEQDTLVPISNSCRLSAALQAPLVKLADCGHTPAEEIPGVFVEVTRAFVQELQGAGAVSDGPGHG